MRGPRDVGVAKCPRKCLVGPDQATCNRIPDENRIGLTGDQ